MSSTYAGVLRWDHDAASRGTISLLDVFVSRKVGPLMSDAKGSQDSQAPRESRQRNALAWRFYGGLGILLILMLLIVALAIPHMPWGDESYRSPEILAGAAVLLGFCYLAFFLWTRRALFEPLMALQAWASKIRQGEFGARFSDTRSRDTGDLSQNVDRLSEWLEALAEERDRELQAQRDRLEERTQLANELHDSLAQTLASLKFQIRVLDDTLRQDSERAIWHEMERIEGSIDEANVELRELIAHFRAPVSQHGLVSGIRRLLSRLRKEAGIEVVLQNQGVEPQVPAEVETQLLRIVQEALANVRKHSAAHMVRVLLSQDARGRCRIIIEDDGEGMSGEDAPGIESHHFGLSIMRERAASINAELVIESEPGEGTRVAIELDL
ncbi:MAG: sensor histidine kinase [Gammaproteobacteria bacterium]